MTWTARDRPTLRGLMPQLADDPAKYGLEEFSGRIGQGQPFVTALLDESAAIATVGGFPPRAAAIERTRDSYTKPASTMTASMLRDMERGGPIEADHIIGDLLRRGGDPAASPTLAGRVIP